jgi:DNA-binding transcriptional regulator YiaG
MKPQPLTKQILKKVKAHKKYKSITDEIVLEKIENFLKSNPTTTNIDKQLIKDIRKELHLSYASFQTKKKTKRKKYLQELEQIKRLDNELAEKFLSITLSTKERLLYYKELYKQIFKITGKPKIILDLGAGLNPTSYPLMNLKKLTYFAYDIDEEDIKFLNQYFKIMKKHKLEGKAKILNLNNNSKISKLPKADIIFLFKVIDLLDKKNHKPSEQLIRTLIPKTKYIVASFSTKTLTRKSMNKPKRKWFELMLERLDLKFKIIKFPNEVFYIISIN